MFNISHAARLQTQLKLFAVDKIMSYNLAIVVVLLYLVILVRGFLTYMTEHVG
jgi:hypothetical protein